MLSIAIFDDNKTHLDILYDLIQDYVVETKSTVKINTFDNAEALITFPARYDIYIMDTDSKEDIIYLSLKIKDIDSDSYFIFVGEDPALAYPAYCVHADHYLLKPIQKDDLYEILNIIRKEIKEDSIIIKTSVGERRVRTSMVNCINIVKRCLCYHLKDGTMLDGQSLRTSFEKAICPLQENPSFLFLPPSLLINLSEIKVIDNDNITFENDEVIYFPKKSHDLIHEKWKTYNRIK